MMHVNPQIKHEAEQRIHEAYISSVQSLRWMEYPQIVSIETFSKCNGRCIFCLYVKIERIGTQFPDSVVFKLIDEVAAFPIHPQRLNFSRVNEPFLDKNIFSYLSYASQNLPKTDLILFSNGQTITDKVIDSLNAIPTFKTLTISFNENDPNVYQQVIGLDQEVTLARLTNLHTRYKSGSVRFSVSLSRVGSSTEADSSYLEWVGVRFPNFPASSNARFSWVGESDNALTDLAPDAGCMQWFLHILSDGSAAFCCIDGLGLKKKQTIDKYSLHEIYNDPAKRALREQITSRHAVHGCNTCVHGMPSNAYIAEPIRVLAL